MTIRLGETVDVLGPALLLVLLGISSKTIGGYLAGRVSGHPTSVSLVVGISLIPKGEFSIVLATMAAASAPAGHPIAPLSAVYVLALSILGPLAMREADRVRGWLPQPRRRRVSPAG